MGKRNALWSFSGLALFALTGCASGDDGAAEPFEAGGGGEDVGSVGTVHDAGAPGAHDSGGVQASEDSGVVTPDNDTGVLPSPLDAGGNDGGPAPVNASFNDVSTGGADAGTDAGAIDAGAIDAGVPDANVSAALLAKWTFDEGTGTTSADVSGEGHTATFVGGVTWSTSGKEGTCLAFDGTTGYADVGTTLVNTSQSFSVLAWMRLAVANAWEVAVSQDDVTGSLFGLKLRGDATDAFDFDVETTDTTNPGFVVAQSTTTAIAATWFHLAGVYDTSAGGTLKIYVNGALQANAAVQQSVIVSTGHFVMGRGLYNGAMGSFLNGTLDDVAVYGGPLSDAQVAAIYTAEK